MAGSVEMKVRGADHERGLLGSALVEYDGRVHVQPAYPQLRLWPDSVAMLYGAPDVLPPLTPTWDKRALALTGRQ